MSFSVRRFAFELENLDENLGKRLETSQPEGQLSVIEHPAYHCQCPESCDYIIVGYLGRLDDEKGQDA